MTHACIKSTHMLDRNGYAQIRHEGKTEYHHRVSFARANGLSMLDLKGKWVLHSCDNPSCINPEHLRIGTPKDNTRDMMLRGRNGYWRREGEAIATAKLTAALVMALRAERLTQVQIAKKYGITQAQVSNIVMRKSWKHVQ